MASQLFSPMWYRVANLRPTLRRNADFHRHVYRGLPCFVLQDHSSGRAHRFTPSAHHFITLMDGKRSVQEIWDLTEESIGDDAPTQEEAIELLSQLHAADLLKADTTPDTRELFRRHQSGKLKKLKQRLMSPMSIRIPLIDPDRFLNRWMPRVRPLFGWFGFCVWLATVVTAVVLTGLHWPELTENIVDRVLTMQNFFLIWLVYPVIKMLHELGHGFAAKRRGCEVHDMGIMLLVFFPMPYVDATASASLPDKYQRIFVAAVGIMVEVFLASLGLFLWLAVEPGLVRALAFNVMLIGGVSTVLFNGNPLLRFDGYYVFADAVDIPNLASRSQQYVGYLFRYYVIGMKEAASPATSAGERSWLFGYAVAATIFRLAIMFGIILFVAGKYFVIGVILAIWAAMTQIIFPVVKKIAFIVSNPELHGHRTRAVTISSAIVVGIALLLFVAPFPLHTQTEGVVWAPEKSEIRAESDGVIERLVAEPNSTVELGDILLETEDPLLASNVDVLAAELEEATAEYHSLRSVKQVEADIVREKIAAIEADLALARQRLDDLIIRSPAQGIFLVDRPQDLEGQYLRRGDRIGFVADLSQGTIRVAVTQASMGRIRERTESVQVLMVERLDEPLTATISREVPAASFSIPSAALGDAGGGSLAVDPTDQSGTKTLEQVFHVELTLDEAVERLGGRTYVRFDHGTEPLGWQWYRQLRQLFLRRFDV